MDDSVVDKNGMIKEEEATVIYGDTTTNKGVE